jgi:hypothetical protein
MMIPRIFLSSALTLLLIACQGMSLATGFRVGFEAAKPFAQSLVESHVLTQEQADAATADIGDGITIAQHAESCIGDAKALPKAQRRIADAKCYYLAAQDLRGILARHHLNIGKLNQLSILINGAISAFEAYYAAVVKQPSGDAVTAGPSAADEAAGEQADKELEQSLKKINEQLKALKK